LCILEHIELNVWLGANGTFNPSSICSSSFFSHVTPLGVFFVVDDDDDGEPADDAKLLFIIDIN
jgi:hypothetical protein